MNDKANQFTGAIVMAVFVALILLGLGYGMLAVIKFGFGV